MTLKRYNYLPHPISEYGPFKALPSDPVQLLLARKDQATWNVMFLSFPELAETHRVFSLRPTDTSQEYDGSLFCMYEDINQSIDGVTIRHQALALPPQEFILWFQDAGGFELFPNYCQDAKQVQVFKRVLASAHNWVGDFSEV